MGKGQITANLSLWTSQAHQEKNHKEKHQLFRTMNIKTKWNYTRSPDACRVQPCTEHSIVDKMLGVEFHIKIQYFLITLSYSAPTLRITQFIITA